MDAVKPSLPPSELKTILEGLLFGLDLISFLIGIFLFFAIAQLWQEERTIEEQEENPRNRAALLKWRRTLLIVAGLSLLAAHVLIRLYPALPPPFAILGPTPAWALIAGLSFMMFYYRGLGMHLKGADAAQYSMILWAATWVMVIWILFFLYWLDKEQELISLTNLDSASFAQYVNTFAQIAGILVAATMVVVTNRRNARHADETSRTQIYQTLELESVELFRFENDNTKLARLMWELDAVPTNISATDAYRLKEYTCQILNLFEMACRFRRKNVMEAEVFGSWVIWIWEVCQRPVFRRQWYGEDGLEYNYVEVLRELINMGLLLSDTSTLSETLEIRRTAFFIYASAKFATGKDHLKWLRRTSIRESAVNEYLSKAEQYRRHLRSAHPHAGALRNMASG